MTYVMSTRCKEMFALYSADGFGNQEVARLVNNIQSY